MRKREIWRQKARVRRAIAKKVAQQKAQLNRQSIRDLLNKICLVITDKTFIQIAVRLGVDTAPERLFENRDFSSHPTPYEAEKEFADNILNFVVAWKFLFPFIESPEANSYFETKWPGFILELKDTFIAITMDGPLPRERRTNLEILKWKGA